MKEIIYDKLVRDRIPEIIKASGKECVTHTLGESEYLDALKKKLLEESEEVEATKNDTDLKEEMADVVEVLAALSVNIGTNLGEIIKIASNKRSRRGGFDKRIFLEKVVEK